MHWPCAQDPKGPIFGGAIENVPLIDTWKEMEVCIILFIYLFILDYYYSFY